MNKHLEQARKYLDAVFPEQILDGPTRTEVNELRRALDSMLSYLEKADNLICVNNSCVYCGMEEHKHTESCPNA